MKKILLPVCFFLVVTPLFSQKLHTTAEVLTIMGDSKLTYSVDVQDDDIECEDYSNRLNTKPQYRVKNESSYVTKEIIPNEKAAQLFQKAESFFQAENQDSALVYYQLSLNADTTLYRAMTYIAQMYNSKHDVQNAIKWYKKAIDRNYIDYMAHWFLADTYLAQNDTKNAVDEIVIAQILNRNNPRIKESLKRILEKDNRTTIDWCFNPQYTLKKVSDTKIELSATKHWLAFAMAKALWAYEPGYKESMGLSQDQNTLLEDRECIAALIPTIDNEKEKESLPPELKILIDVIMNKYVDHYILYEIVLPKNPNVVYQLTEKQIMMMKDYVLKHRHPIK